MKKVLLGAIILGAFIAGCKEVDPPINFSSGRSVGVYTDSVYTVSPVPATAAHQVLVEDFTGQTCPNCPNAHQDLDNESLSYPGRLNVIGMYFYSPNLSQTIPSQFAKHDFRDSGATNISTNIYNSIGQLPTLGIDRLPLDGTEGDSIQLNYINYATYIPIAMAVTDSLNLSVTSAYNSSTNSANITVNVIYTQNVTQPQSLNVCVVEDSIVDVQSWNISPYLNYPNPYTDLDTNYLFMDVIRHYASYVPTGDPFLTSHDPITAGTALQRTYNNVTVNNALVPAHCRVVVFVSSPNGPYYTIFQSAQCPLIP